MIQVTLKGGVVREYESGTTVGQVAASLGAGLAKAACAGRVDGEVRDLRFPLEADCALEILTFEDQDGKRAFWHTTSHVLAQAVQHLFPEAKFAIGPAIDNGFYYDFDVPTPFSAEDLEKIEAEMAKIVKAALPLESFTLEPAQALELMKDQPYKVELIEEHSGKGERISFYRQGDFTDLCAGPHLMTTAGIKAIRLTSCTGAYWRGSEKNKMLSRIYGISFPKKSELEEYLARIEEAKRRDHRKLGRELGFFTFHEDVAPGMVFWLPKGMLMRTILEDFWRREHIKRNYDLVQGPQLLRVETWQRSGHYDHYRQNMYFTQIEDDQYGIKPMNCISHMLIYRNDLRSYRDLPQRYFELGVVHRHEKSGTLHGLLRVRQFTQDDAHILCTPEQLEGEILGVIHLIRDLMHLFGFDYKVGISTRPKDSIGTDEAWELATNALIEAVKKADMPYEINEGDGAFYGPKIDVRLLDCIGREWQCSTIQVDFTLPERFDLTYVGQDGERHRPVMVHRAIMGSLERFIGVLIEQYAGAMPTWLAPEQARILTVTDAHNEAALKACEELKALGIRVTADTRNEKLGFKVREAQLAKVPYILVVGEKEAQAGGVNVRLRNGDNLGLKSVAEVAALIRTDSEEPFKNGGMRYSFS